MMKISFIIPVYNCKDYLPACVDSIRAVGAENYEILLIDDGSTDGSGALCDDLAGKFPEIRDVHQANAGVSAARNRGLQEAAGEKILFFDADDSADPEMLREILTDPRCTQTDLTIFGLTFDYYKNGKCYRRDPLYFPTDGILTKQQWGASFSELYAQNSLSPVWNKVFSREILFRNELKLNEDMFLYEDFEFVLRYMQHCGSIWNVPKSVYHYRQTEDEGNATRRLRRIDSIPLFLQPLETAMDCLRKANPAISVDDMDKVLQMLYVVLAKDKISGSNLEEIGRICRDFRQWSENQNLPLKVTKFQSRLMEGKALRLLLTDRKTALRHKVAVWVKSRIYHV